MKFILILFIVLIIGMLKPDISLSFNKWTYTITNEHVSLDTIKKPFFVVFYQQPSCGSCFTSLNTVLDSLSSNKIKIIVIININSSAIDRRKETVFVQNRFKCDRVYYVNTVDEMQNNKLNQSIFSEYKIVSTPCLLYVSQSGEYFFEHRELFPFNYKIENIYRLISEKIKGN